MGETPGESSEERLWGDRMNSTGGAADRPHMVRPRVWSIRGLATWRSLAI